MRVLTDKEKRLRAMYPELALTRPDASWQTAYMEQIDQGWHDYQHEVERLRDYGAFSLFIERIDSGQSWNGTQECHVRWLVDLAARKILGRVRLKNIQTLLPVQSGKTPPRWSAGTWAIRYARPAVDGAFPR